MNSQLLEQVVSTPGVVYGVVGFAAAYTVFSKLSQRPNLDAFPAVGSSTWIGSWWAGFKFVGNIQNVIQEGYKKYKTTPFKVAELTHWTVILSSRTCVQELARAPEDEFSILATFADANYTIGHGIVDNPTHVDIIHTHLNRNIQFVYPEVRDELATALIEVLDLRGNEWKCVPALSTLGKVICRASNRLFVGLPLCRHPEWMDLCLRYTMNIAKGMIIVGLFPTFMKTFAARFLTNIHADLELGMKLLGPIIKERMKYLDEYGKDYPDKPNDFLSWLIDEAKGPELTVERLIHRILVMNFVSNHTSSHTFTQSLLYLAANPQHVQPLREEVESIVAEEGWSKTSLSKMGKVDSFLRECLRFRGPSSVTLSRKAMKDYTFSDGTFIPKGAWVLAPAFAVHLDEDLYENPDEFDPFRFANMREEEGKDGKYRFASTTPEYLPFGHGKHACPGRFFAAYELKSMLAHIVVTYDVKLEDNTAHPPSQLLGYQTLANPNAKIMFRRRAE